MNDWGQRRARTEKRMRAAPAKWVAFWVAMLFLRCDWQIVYGGWCVSSVTQPKEGYKMRNENLFFVIILP